MPHAENAIELIHGIPNSMRDAAVDLYDDAFGSKLAVGIPSRARRTALLAESLNAKFAFAAVADGQLVGVAGYKTTEGAFTDGMTYSLLLKHAGLIRGNWCALVFSFYERSLIPGQLLMDGIVVDASMRGRGIGTRLLNALCDFGACNGFTSVRLDVIDTNPLARSMYERNGFIETKTESFEYLRWLFGFGGSTTLVRDVTEAR